VTATDYIDLAAMAENLITESGREVTVVRYKQSADDSAKPWHGPGDPTTVPDATDTVYAAFVAPGSMGKYAQDVDAMKRCEQACLVGPGASFDLTTADEVVDGGVRWHVESATVVKPGATVLLYMLGLRR
jgi:hypothetical protein